MDIKECCNNKQLLLLRDKSYPQLEKLCSMSGRRRRKSRDSDDDGSDGDDTEDDGDDESDDDEVEGTAEEPTSDETDPVVESLPAISEDIPVTNVESFNPVKFEPKEILKNTNSEALQDTERRDKNNKRREARREADFSSQSQRKNPTFVPLSGNFFLHDDRESGRLVDDAREPSQLTEANLGRQALEQNQQKTR
jgi:CASC3/Barentsz eIF4AIII binding